MLTVLLAVALAADPAPRERKRLFPEPVLDVTEVALGAGFGFLWTDRGAWNEAWRSRGYQTYGPLAITPLSVNGELYANRHVPGFDYIQYSDIGGEPGTEPVSTALTYALTELSYGFSVVQLPYFWLTPRVGAGLLDVRSTAQPQGTYTFDDGAFDAAQSLTISKQAMLLDLGLGLSTFVPFGKVDGLGIQSGLRFTLRLGGLVQLFDTAGYNSLGQEVTGAPDLRLDGPYARIILSPSLVHRAVHTPRAKRSRRATAD